MAKFPVPSSLSKNCPQCNAKLSWEGVGLHDLVIRREKVDHYRAECPSCGTVHFRDQRGQPVEPAVLNLPPDLSDTANSPQGPQPYPGTARYGVGVEPPKPKPVSATPPAAAAEPAG